MLAGTAGDVAASRRRWTRWPRAAAGARTPGTRGPARRPLVHRRRDRDGRDRDAVVGAAGARRHGRRCCPATPARVRRCRSMMSTSRRRRGRPARRGQPRGRPRARRRARRRARAAGRARPRRRCWTARWTLRGDARHGERVHVHHGTREAPGRLRDLGDGLWQLRLEQPLMAADGDRVVVRRLSPPDTLGGGVVLDAAARRHGPGAPDVLARLLARRDGRPEPRAAARRRSRRPRRAAARRRRRRARRPRRAPARGRARAAQRGPARRRAPRCAPAARRGPRGPRQRPALRRRGVAEVVTAEIIALLARARLGLARRGARRPADLPQARPGVPGAPRRAAGHPPRCPTTAGCCARTDR